MSLRSSAAKAMDYLEEVYHMRSADPRISDPERREYRGMARVASAAAAVISINGGTVDEFISQLKGADPSKLKRIIDAANPTAKVAVNGSGWYRAHVAVPLNDDAVLGYLAKLVNNLDSLPINASR